MAHKMRGARAGARRMRKLRHALTVVAIAAFSVAIVAFGLYAHALIDENQGVETQRNLNSVFFDNNKTAEVLAAEPTSSATRLLEEHLVTQAVNQTEPAQPVIEEPFISDRFIELINENPDVIGWITAGSDISTPVVYRDNDYYLDHDFYGNENAGGTVFIDAAGVDRGIQQFEIYYGHNMRNGSMFGHLDEYMDLAYLKENWLVTYYSVYNNEVLQFVPFAVVDASMEPDNEHYFNLRRFDVFGEPTNTESVAAFIGELQERSMYYFEGVDVSTDDKIICLVTCTYSLTNARLMVFCRELRGDETADDMDRLINEGAARK